jgi:trans-2-enoyl-CoA reductase
VGNACQQLHNPTKPLYLSINFSKMTRQIIIERTLKIINQLPEDKAEEISDFADFVFKRYEENELTNGIQKMTSESQAFDFLNEEEEIYSLADLREVYNA